MSKQERETFTAEATYSITPPAEGSKGRATLTGYAMVWGATSGERYTARGDVYKVRLLPNSAVFQKPTAALYHHSFRDFLGSTADGSVRLSSDDVGVKSEIDLPDTTLGRDLEWLVGHGRIRGMSFAMIAAPGSYSVSKEDGIEIRSFSNFEVDEVTITPIPAFIETSIGVKSDESADTQLSDSTKEHDDMLRKDEQYRSDYYAMQLAEYQRQGASESESNNTKR